tara:strand:- start:12588 stop:12947 length:360 start_codon:yes stop_codon:yes gene_type:complete
MKYYDYNDIPKDLKKVIRESKGLTRITELPLHEINNIVKECQEELVQLEKLKNFTVISNTGGTSTNVEFEEVSFASLEDVYVHLDRLTDYDNGSALEIVFKQADRVVKYYSEGNWRFVE